MPWAEIMRHRAVVTLRSDDLRTYLDLPDGLSIVGLWAEFDPPMIKFRVVGPALPEVADDAAAPPLGGYLSSLLYADVDQETGHATLYRRFAWSQQDPKDREEEMLAYIFRLRTQVHQAGGKPAAWPEALRPQLLGTPAADA